jgi:hypothetical protein
MIKFLWKEGTDADEIQRRLQTVYHDSNSVHSPISDCVRNFQLTRTEIHDFYRSGRRPVDHIDDDILFLLRMFPFHRVHTLAETLRVSPSTILYHLRNSLGLKRYHFRWVLQELRCHLKEKIVAMCRELMEPLKMEESFGFARVVTGDESWLYLSYSHTHISSVCDDERAFRIDQSVPSEKHDLTVLWSMRGPLVLPWSGPDDNKTASYLGNVIMPNWFRGSIRERSFRGNENCLCISTMLVLTIMQGPLNLSTDNNSSDNSTGHIRRM